VYNGRIDDVGVSDESGECGSGGSGGVSGECGSDNGRKALISICLFTILLTWRRV
jgi:hypothetical protein